MTDEPELNAETLRGLAEKLRNLAFSNIGATTLMPEAADALSALLDENKDEIERVARAISTAAHADAYEWQLYVEEAKAAIAAIAQVEEQDDNLE